MQSCEETPDTPVALLSKYTEVQDVAVAMGAKGRFGKDTLTGTATRAVLAATLGH